MHRQSENNLSRWKRVCEWARKRMKRKQNQHTASKSKAIGIYDWCKKQIDWSMFNGRILSSTTIFDLALAVCRKSSADLHVYKSLKATVAYCKLTSFYRLSLFLARSSSLLLTSMQVGSFRQAHYDHIHCLFSKNPLFIRRLFQTHTSHSLHSTEPVCLFIIHGNNYP